MTVEDAMGRGDPGPDRYPPTDDAPSKPARIADAASTEAATVASSAASGARDVVDEATTQAKAVAGQARQHLSTVVDQTKTGLRDQADERSRQAAGGLRTFSDQVNALAEGRPGDAGPLAGYLRDAETHVSKLADRLEQGGPQGIVDDVSDFARRRPVLFLAAAVGAGFVAGRLLRAGSAAQRQAGDGDAGTGVYTPSIAPALAAPPSIVTSPLDPPPFDAPVLDAPLYDAPPRDAMVP